MSKLANKKTLEDFDYSSDEDKLSENEEKNESSLDTDSDTDCHEEIEYDDDDDIHNIIFTDIDDTYAYGKLGEFDVMLMKSNGYINASKLCTDSNIKLKREKRKQYLIGKKLKKQKMPLC